MFTYLRTASNHDKQRQMFCFVFFFKKKHIKRTTLPKRKKCYIIGICKQKNLWECGILFFFCCCFYQVKLDSHNLHSFSFSFDKDYITNKSKFPPCFRQEALCGFFFFFCWVAGYLFFTELSWQCRCGRWPGPKRRRRSYEEPVCPRKPCRRIGRIGQSTKSTSTERV